MIRKELQAIRSSKESQHRIDFTVDGDKITESAYKAIRGKPVKNEDSSENRD